MILPKQTYDALEPGEYAATVQRIEEQEGQYGVQLRWSFHLVAPGENYDGRTILSWCSPIFTPKSKLARWARAVLGNGIDDADAIDTTTMHGRPCRLVLSVVAGSDGGERNKVSEILPPRRETPTQPVTATPVLAGTPAGFTGPDQAISWGYQQGVFASAAAAAAEYNRVKAEIRPATAGQMWAAWIARVEELQAGVANDDPF